MGVTGNILLKHALTLYTDILSLTTLAPLLHLVTTHAIANRPSMSLFVEQMASPTTHRAMQVARKDSSTTTELYVSFDRDCMHSDSMFLHVHAEPGL